MISLETTKQSNDGNQREARNLSVTSTVVLETDVFLSRSPWQSLAVIFAVPQFFRKKLNKKSILKRRERRTASNFVQASQNSDHCFVKSLEWNSLQRCSRRHVKCHLCVISRHSYTVWKQGGKKTEVCEETGGGERKLYIKTFCQHHSESTRLAHFYHVTARKFCFNELVKFFNILR